MAHVRVFPWLWRARFWFNPTRKAVIPINSRVLGWRVFVMSGDIERTSVDYFRGGCAFDGPGVSSSSDSF